MKLGDVSAQLGVDISMLAKIEKNERKPTKQFISRVAAFFQVSEKELTVNYLSDTIAYKLLEEEDLAVEIIKLAEEKINYLNHKS